MYLYFDRNGNLKEFINDPAREGSQNVNQLYIYVEPGIQNEESHVIDGQTVKVLMMLQTYPSGTVDFRLPELLENVTDEERNLINTVLFTLETDTVYETIEYNPERDLKYFLYGRYYQFVKVTIPAEVFAISGRVDCSISLVNPETDPSNLTRLVFDVFSFMVQNSVILKNINITQAQYAYLLSKIGNQITKYESILKGESLASFGNLGDYQVGQALYVCNSSEAKLYEINSSYQAVLVVDLKDKARVFTTSDAPVNPNTGDIWVQPDEQLNVANTRSAPLFEPSENEGEEICVFDRG